MIESKSKQKAVQMTSEPDTQLLDFLSKKLEQGWPLDASYVAVKPEGDNRWQIYDQLTANERGVEGKTIKQLLNISGPDDRIDLKKIVTTLVDGESKKSGYKFHSSGFDEGQRTHKTLTEFHDKEKYPHDDFLPNENHFKAKNREVKQLKRNLDADDRADEQTYVKKRKEADNFAEEVELSSEHKQKKMDEMKESYAKKKKERRKPYQKRRDGQPQRKKPDADEWRDIDEEASDD